MEAPHGKYEAKKESAFKSYQQVQHQHHQQMMRDEIEGGAPESDKNINNNQISPERRNSEQ
jgi:hypothetical protein